jgi:biotin transport system ATP-binding protein
MIEISDVSHGFGEGLVLRSVTLRLAERRIGVIGSNGSGKSTFARLLNGLTIPDRGVVRVAGLDTRREGRAVRRLVGFVFQDPDVQIVYPQVAEDVAFGLKPLRLGKEETARRVSAVLARCGLSDRGGSPAHGLSGGQKQMLALASVLVREPSWIVLDEPTTLLDLRNKRRVMAMLAELPQSLVMVTHDLDLIAGFDRVLLFEGGRVVGDGAPADVIGRYLGMMA